MINLKGGVAHFAAIVVFFVLCFFKVDAASAADSPTIRFNWVSGYGETATWAWYNEAGTLMQTASGQTGGNVIPPQPDPLTIMFQDALNYAAAKGLPFRAVGATYIPETAVQPFLQTWATITIPAQSSSHMEFDNVMWLQRPANGGDGVVFDSSQLMKFTFTGEMFYRGPGVAVRFKPTNRERVDSNFSINSGEFFISSITVQSGGPLMDVGTGNAMAAVAYETSNGKIWANKFRYGQISGHNVANYGVLVFNPPNSEHEYGFTNNAHDINYVMQCKDAAVQVGLHGGNAAVMGLGYWNIRLLFPNTSKPFARGLDTWGQYDLIDIAEIRGPVARGAVFEEEAMGNN